jgi:hypothetical protein
MMNYRMKRFEVFLHRLNHDDRPPEEQSPVQASAWVELVSFLVVYWLTRDVISSFRLWWAELLAYAIVPILLAFIILYRSAWHQEWRAATRTIWAGLFSCVLFAGVLLAIGLVAVLVTLTYISNFDGFPRFHY